ncbi:MAG: gliding motility-associated peptidyl-prolyl isomerase GldI [Flavobacteriales bacterium]|mgnify:CR=1 FL=1|jgi:gliding motility-associated peptidyl-prolyl isomerase|nr:gliding motility-associated peptidyl-prolyl isomerase GldI [Flavobacteriales bacterium]
MRFNKITFGFVILMFVACNNPVPRYPVLKNGGNILTSSVAHNKQLVKLQDAAFKQIISENPNVHFINSKSGFWYSYLIQKEDDNARPQTGDDIEFTYQVADLENHLIYTKEDIGLLRYRVDKEEIINGLQQGLKLIKEGEEVVFLFPSFMAYGVLGDRNKIKTNQPLIYTVYLKKIINHKN